MKELLRKRKLLIFSVYFASFLLPKTTNAASAGQWFGGVGGWIANALVGSVLMLVAEITNVLVDIGAKLLSWSIDFTSLSYTNPATNPVIAEGLKITQSLANMALVLMLVWIGIAIMLRLEGYETKKMLTRFVLTALLVNFAPLICGLAVDAANIIMNYFLDGVSNAQSSFTGRMKNIFSIYLQGLAPSDWYNSIGSVANLLIAVIINIGTFFVFAAFAFILIIRKMIIWVLVILAPIAFVLRIAPFSMVSEYYGKWKNAFIEWTTTGIFLSFFLFLGATVSDSNKISPSTFSGYTGVGSEIMPFMVPLIFYNLGLVFGLSFMGAGGWAKGMTKSGSKWLAGRTWQTTRDVTRRVSGYVPGAQGITDAVRTRLAATASSPGWGRNIDGSEQAGVWGWAKRAVYNNTIRPTAGFLSTDRERAKKEQIKKMQESIKGQSAATQRQAYFSAKSDEERVAILNAAIEDKQLNDLNVSDADITRLIGVASRWNGHQTIQRANPHLGDQAQIPTTVQQMRTTDCGRMNRTSVDRNNADPNTQARARAVLIAMIDSFSKEQAAAAFHPDALGMYGVNMLLAEIEQQSGSNNRNTMRQWLTNTANNGRGNRRLLRYLTDSGIL